LAGLEHRCFTQVELLGLLALPRQYLPAPQADDAMGVAATQGNEVLWPGLAQVAQCSRCHCRGHSDSHKKSLKNHSKGIKKCIKKGQRASTPAFEGASAGRAPWYSARLSRLASNFDHILIKMYKQGELYNPTQDRVTFHCNRRR
jgi:hypothetical protein